MASRFVFSRRIASNIFRVFSSSCRSLSSDTHAVNLTQDGRRMELLCDTDAKRIYHGVWLRHNCRCPECYSEVTNMLKLRICEVSKCKEIVSARIDGKLFNNMFYTL